MYEKIKTFEDACTKLGLDAAKVLPDFSMFPEQHQKAMTAHAKLIIIADALNDDWKPDWQNGEWDKYYPWFVMGSPSGSGFSSTATLTGIRVRLPAPAFASNLVRLRFMQDNNLKNFIKITL